MDDVEVQHDCNLWVDGLEEMLVEILYHETIKGKLVGSKITNWGHVRISTRFSVVDMKSVDASRCNNNCYCIGGALSKSTPSNLKHTI